MVHFFSAGVFIVLDMCSILCYDFFMVMAIHNRMSCQVDFNISLIDGNLIFVTEDCGNFFQWQALGVWEVEPHDETTDNSWDDEAEVLVENFPLVTGS